MAASFRLMTVNVLRGESDPSDFAAILDDARPDVLVVQELGPAQAEIIADRYSRHHLRPRHDVTGVGVASRIQAELGDLALPHRSGTRADLRVEGQTVRIAGVHLVNPIAFPWWSSVRARREQVEAILDWGEQGDPQVARLVIGDLNASPSWPAYRQLTERWADLVAGHAKDAGADLPRTWGYRPGWPQMLRIDHVLGEGVRATDVAVHPLTGSDHSALLADLELVGKQHQGS